MLEGVPLIKRLTDYYRMRAVSDDFLHFYSYSIIIIAVHNGGLQILYPQELNYIHYRCIAIHFIAFKFLTIRV